MSKKIATRLSPSTYRIGHVSFRQGLVSHNPTATMLTLCFLIFVFQGIADGVINCSGQSNGNNEITCTGYTECRNGAAIHHTCPTGQMYSLHTKRCDSPSVPCSIKHDCSGLADKRYPDLQTQCRTYYTCNNGYFYGHNFCSPGLVYDESMQLCNWPVNVAPPCGTHSVLVGRSH